MTREKTKEAIKVMQAYVDGKEIQMFVPSYGEWEDLSENTVGWAWNNYDYRIKPEPHYRPFESAEEVMEAIKEHGSWVRWRGNKSWVHKITSFSDIKIKLSCGGFSMEEALTEYSFLDGTPFGKLEGENTKPQK